ncbi:MAG: BamA/TamA family outer membrane protein [Armatimonadota bacterium]|nr:BamA/TamA family outer membrane protein [bacterium]
MIFRASKIFGVVLLVLVSVSVTLMAQEVQKVAEVVVAGNDNINSDTIVNAVALKPGDDYTEQAVEQDKAAIMSLGYFSAVTVHTEDSNGGIKITYEVSENPKITGINIVGSDPISSQQVLDLMKTKSGQILNTTTLNQDIETIQNFYGEQGYIAYVTEDIGVNPQTGCLTVPILVHRVEEVDITDNKKTREFVFLREMKTQPGSIFNWKALSKDIMKLYSLDILEDIKRPEINPGSEVGLVKVVIPVVEKKTGQASVGVGYSSKQRLVGQARYSETNFRGLGQGLNVMWEQGTSSSATGGNGSYEVGFYEPWIDKKHTSLNVSGFDKLIYRFSSGIFNSSTLDEDDDIYNERHIGADFTLSRPLSEKTRVYVGARFENVDTDPSLLTTTENNQTVISDYVNIVQKGNVGTASVRLVRNTRDLDLDPAAGGYDAFALEVGTTDATRYKAGAEPTDAPVPFPFNGGFQKSSVDVRRYYSKQGAKTSPQDKRNVLAVRVRLGYGNGTIPYFEQFFVGGGESLRGYKEDRFWGNKMLLTSVEYRKPIAQSIAGVLFLDYGDAWGTANEFDIEDLPQTENFDGHYGTGVGLRVATPIGNLRLDYAVGDDGARTHFSMGQAF